MSILTRNRATSYFAISSPFALLAVAGLLMLVFCVTSAAGFAQALSAAEIYSLQGPSGPQPGMYHIRPLNTDMCIFPNRPLGGGIEHLILEPCAVTVPISVVPGRAVAFTDVTGGYTLRTRNETVCATKARNVIFGPASIDSLNCDHVGTTFCDVGAADQRFSIKILDGHDYSIILVVPPAGGGTDVFDVRDSDLQHGGLIAYGWHNGANQKFHFERVANLSSATESCIESLGWRLGPDGPRWGGRATGVNLYGGDMAPGTPSNLDNCVSSCIGNTSCRAWSYVRGATPENGVCWLKGNIIPSPNRDPNVISGIVRP